MNLSARETTELLIKFERIANSLEKIASCINEDVLQMRDVDRAKVYSQHLGEKLRKDSLRGEDYGEEQSFVDSEG